MHLEKAIKQSRGFDDIREKVIVNIVYTFFHLNEKLENHFLQFGLSQKQFNVLRILKGAGEPISTLQIRERMLNKMSDISRMVDRMEQKHLIKKCKNSLDKRLVDVSITVKGKNLLTEINARNEEILGLINLTTSESKALSDLLDKSRN